MTRLPDMTPIDQFHFDAHVTTTFYGDMVKFKCRHGLWTVSGIDLESTKLEAYNLFRRHYDDGDYTHNFDALLDHMSILSEDLRLSLSRHTVTDVILVAVCADVPVPHVMVSSSITSADVVKYLRDSADYIELTKTTVTSIE